MQASDELSPSLSHVPRWLGISATTPAIVCLAFGLLPASERASVPYFVQVVIEVLAALGWLALAVCVARAMRQHWQYHEPVYAASDAWKVLVVGSSCYVAEGQLLPILPAVRVAQYFFVFGFMSPLLILPIFTWYSRRHVRRIAP